MHLIVEHITDQEESTVTTCRNPRTPGTSYKTIPRRKASCEQPRRSTKTSYNEGPSRKRTDHATRRFCPYAGYSSTNSTQMDIWKSSRHAFAFEETYRIPHGKTIMLPH